MVRDLECKLERGVMMMAKLKKMLTHLGKNESGQGALAIVIILLMLGAIILTPLLVFMSTGLKAGGVYESKVQEFYAADAGVEDGLWQIKNDKLSTLFASYPYDPYNYTANYSYPIAPSTSDYEINNENVTVNITNVWIPSNIATPNPAVATSIIENGTLIVTGKVISYPGGQRGYEIKISYSWQDDDSNGTKLKIATIGAWLSGGFNYTSGSGNLSSYTSTCVPYCGGQAITWNKNPNETFKLSTGYPLVRTFNFNFTGPADQNPNAVSWITTTGVSAISYSWDADTEPYRIKSTAGSTTDEAYVIKNELRKLGAAISGDYCAVGNTLMAATTDIEYRDRLYKERSTTIQSSNPSAAGYIPPGAAVEAAFLYWSGWIDWHYPGSSSGINKLKYSNDTSPDKHILVNQTAKVDRVKFGVPTNMTTVVTASKWQVEENVESGAGTANTWSYACFADVTSLVREFIAAGKVSSNGAGTYNLSQIPQARNTSESQYSFSFYGGGTTGYPLGTPAPTSSPDTRYQYAYAGWSLIIIYSSPETKGHQLYIYGVQTGDFAFINGQANEKLNITISGFLAPADPTGSHMTCFVGEGDAHYGCSSPCGSSSHPSGGSDYIELNGHRLSDGICSDCNVWNSYSNVLGGTAVNGIDIDDFDMSGWIGSRSTTAVVTVGSDYDIYNVVYIILSFRSLITTGGTISYLIH